MSELDARVEGIGLSSIQEINALPREVAEALYARLIPEEVLERFQIDPGTLRGAAGAPLVRITAPADKTWARVEVRESTEDRDPALLVDVEMSPLSVPELAFVQITDPRRPRYAIDRDPDGRDTLFGTTSRNLEEELRAGLTRAKVAAIGPIVVAALAERGITADIVPEQPFVMKRMTAAITAAFGGGPT